jgi:hypothetical protein
MGVAYPPSAHHGAHDEGVGANFSAVETDQFRSVCRHRADGHGGKAAPKSSPADRRIGTVTKGQRSAIRGADGFTMRSAGGKALVTLCRPAGCGGSVRKDFGGIGATRSSHQIIAAQPGGERKGRGNGVLLR